MGIFFHSREYVKGMEINEIKGIFIMFTSETIKHLIQLEKKIHCFYTYNFKKCPYMKGLQYSKIFIFRKYKTTEKTT